MTYEYEEIHVKAHTDSEGSPFRFMHKGRLYECRPAGETTVEQFLREMCGEKKLEDTQE
jgi:hypothetical protein